MNIYDTQVLTAVINSLVGKSSFLSSTFFPNLVFETSEKVSFDVAHEGRKLAPLVSPFVEGSIRRERGYTTKTIEPAYVKVKTPLHPSAALRRTIGEPITGNLSPAQRQQIRLSNTLTDHKEMVDRRVEAMAAEVLRTGKLVLVGDGYPSIELDFGRHNTLTKTLTLGDRWGETGATPLTNLDAWSDEALALSGSGLKDYVMDPKAWLEFKKDDEVIEALKNQKADDERPSLMLNGQSEEGPAYKGIISNFRIWVYNSTYYDDAGVLQKFLPDNTVIGVGQAAGRQHYGAIQDEEAEIQALKYFSKSWLEKDPGNRMVLTQSAPVVAPYRPNATLCVTVR